MATTPESERRFVLVVSRLPERDWKLFSIDKNLPESENTVPESERRFVSRLRIFPERDEVTLSIVASLQESESTTQESERSDACVRARDQETLLTASIF